jgi:hypothetical protein
MEINRHRGLGNAAGAGSLGRPSQAASGRDEAGEAGASSAAGKIGQVAGENGANAARGAEGTPGVGAAGQVDTFCKCPGSTREAQESNAHNSTDKATQFEKANA